MEQSQVASRSQQRCDVLPQAFDWLNPSPNAPPLPADSVVVQRAAGNAAVAPRSQDSQNVRNFVSQAGFTSGKAAPSTATTGAAAATSQQGRRLAEVLYRSF